MGKYDALLAYGTPASRGRESAADTKYSDLMQYGAKENALQPEQPGMLSKIGHLAKENVESLLPTTTRFLSNEAPKEAYEQPYWRQSIDTPARLAQDIMTIPDRFGGAVRGLLTGEKNMDVQNINTHMFKPETDKLYSAAAESREEGKPVQGYLQELAGTGLSFIGPDLLASAAKKPIVKSAQAIGKGGNKILGKLASELSNVTEEALRKYGVGVGRGAKELAQAAGTEKEIGRKILGALDDFDRFLPERNAIHNALDNMEPVNGQRIVDVLQQSKKSGKLKQTREANATIDELIKDISSTMSENGRIAAKDVFDIRQQIDDVVGDGFGKESNMFLTAAKKARHQIKDELIESAKFSRNDEYIQAMETLAHKMKLADELKGYVGKSQQVQDRRIESFVSNLFGKNSDEKQRIVQQLGELFGEEFLEKSKLARLAADLGQGGRPSLMPNWRNGRSPLGLLTGSGIGLAAGGPAGSGLGAMAGLAMSSPRVASTVLGTVDALGRGVTTAGKGGEALLRGAGLGRGVQSMAGGTARIVNPEEENAKRRAMERMSKPFQR